MTVDPSILPNQGEPPNDPELGELIRRVPYPAPARDLVAPALLARPVRFPLLAGVPRYAALTAACLLIALYAAHRLPDAQPGTAAAPQSPPTLDVSGPELRTRLTAADKQLEDIGQPSTKWVSEDNARSTFSIRTSYPASMARRLDSLQSRLDALRLELEETPEPPGPRPTTRTAPETRRKKQGRYT